MNRPRPGFILLRRCALGLWLCAIALLGVVEFRRAAHVADGLAMDTPAWLWLIGSTVSGIFGIVLLVRELYLHRSRQDGENPPRRVSGM